MEFRIKSYNKTKDKNKKKEKEKKREDSKNNVQRFLKTNKSMVGISSDNETIKSEATRGDTLNENNKTKYIYRKSVNGKNFSFAIRNYFSAKNKQIQPMKKRIK